MYKGQLIFQELLNSNIFVSDNVILSQHTQKHNLLAEVINCEKKQSNADSVQVVAYPVKNDIF